MGGKELLLASFLVAASMPPALAEKAVDTN
jgi:hypothetical protein